MWCNCALSERITGVADEARARRSIVDDLALSVDPTSTRTRILALGVYAGEVRGTVGIDNALGSASLVGIADVVGDTGARADTVLLAANGIRAARRGFAGRQVFRDRRCDWNTIFTYRKT